MPYHMIPGLLSSAFIGRDSELKWLKDALDPENEKFVGARAGIYGLTGSGKTQLVLNPSLTTPGSFSTDHFTTARCSSSKSCIGGTMARSSFSLHLPPPSCSTPSRKHQRPWDSGSIQITRLPGCSSFITGFARIGAGCSSSTTWYTK